jgi:outer membrane lipoprotein-sorting protein
MKKFTLALVAFLFIGGTALKAQTVDEILAKYAEVNGSAEKWSTVTTLTLTGKFIQQGMEFPLTSQIVRPNKVYTIINVMGKEIIQGYDGKDAWTINPLMGKETAEMMSESEAKDIKDQAQLEDPLLTYKTEGHKVELLGTEDIEGTPCFKIKLVEKNGDESTIFIDQESYLKVMERSKSTNPQMAGMELDTFFSDYKDLGNGLLMWHAMDTKVAGQSVAAMSVSSWEFNKKINEKIFAMPKK